MKKTNIYLIGFMGTGKSSVAVELAESLGRPVIELDDQVAKKCGMTIADYFRQNGEAAFRDLESDAILELRDVTKTVISCGGGVALRPENIVRMKQNGWVVLLTATAFTIMERIGQSTNRPLFNENSSQDQIQALMNQRERYDHAAADVTVCTDQKSLEQICWEILTKLNNWEL